MTVKLHEVAQAIHSVFTTDADDAARSHGLVLRDRLLSGQGFVQTLTFGWLDNPKASLVDLVAFASDNGLGKLTKQGLDNWFCQSAIGTLQETLHNALDRAIGQPAKRTPLLNRFRGVHLIDGSTTSLHPSLASWLPGCGGRTPEAGAAGIKLVVTLEITSGQIGWISAHPGRMHDQAAGATFASFTPGALLLFDLGFFNLDMLQYQDGQGVRWLCRIQSQTVVRSEHGGKKVPLTRFLAHKTGHRFECVVWVGSSHQLRCRLLAKRVPSDVAAQRREHLQQEAKKKGQTVSDDRLALCDWSVLITNTLHQQLSVEEALELYRVRWQIELLFKVWKSTGELDQSRGERPDRILCEFYAKLLGLVVQHWATLLAGDPMEISEQTGARRVRKRAAALLLALIAKSAVKALSRELSLIAAKLREWCRIEKRKSKPNTRQRLQEAEEISRLQAELTLT